MTRHKWVWAVWEILGVLTFLSGFTSGNVVMMVVGIVAGFGFASLYFTSYVRSDHIVKRALEVIFMLSAFGIIVYGYIVTASLILGVMTIFVVAMVFVAFILSYLLPRIRSESTERDEVRKWQFRFSLSLASVGLFLMLDTLYPDKLVSLFSAIGTLIASGSGVFSALKWRGAEKETFKREV
ncbi:MAG: hypothetical protein OEY40_03905 [Candidatus Bathyarchaeota archaeon]|nr:hypothetical protein [Candidatus Bathyarchaeota archaeon]MDH5595841.1 hypothetical protein [Candidatus Bathyarchaeota archaeon]